MTKTASQERSRAGQDHDPVLDELRMSNRLLAMLAVRGLAPKEAILLLDAVGFRPAQIGAVLGMSPNAIRVSLHRSRKLTSETPSSGETE